MKQIKYSIIVLLILLCCTSCKKDFLEVSDRTFLLREAYVTDLKTMGEYMNGCYYKLITECYTGLFSIYGDIVADNVNPVLGSIFFAAHYPWRQMPELGSATLEAGNSCRNLNSVWAAGYKIIRECSYILKKIEEFAKENLAKADNIRGQAFAMRAFVHFILVNNFAQAYAFTSDGSHPGVPYITTSEWSQPYSRQTVAEVYSGIISDLNNAIGLLIPGPVTDARLMNRNAAEALLSRVYLFKGEHLSAKNLARQVLANVPLMTNSPSKKMYPDSLFCKGESEALFHLSPELITGSIYFPGAYFRLSLLFPTSEMVAIIRERPNDLRNAWLVNSTGKVIVTKFPESKIPGVSYAATSYYQPLIRSSEMYLIAAESYAKLGLEDSSRFYLDIIRQRADITAPNSIASGHALLDSIYKERRKEFAFENMRMYELQRLKKDVNRLDPLTSLAQNLPFGSNNAIAPIPLDDVRTGWVKQNPGY